MPATKSVTAKSKTKKPAVPKTKQKSGLNSTATPEHSEIRLDYSRVGSIGFAQVIEIINISNTSETELKKRILSVFHFARNTKITNKFDSGKTAAFMMNSKIILSLTQKADDFENEVFTMTRYKSDGMKQSTRKYSYLKTKNLILDAFGFETKIDDEEENEEFENSVLYSTPDDSENEEISIFDDDEFMDVE